MTTTCAKLACGVAGLALLTCAAMAAGDNAMPPVPAESPAQIPGQPGANYHLVPRDTVHIKVFQEDDLETTGRIDKDGYIAFPLLGTAKIGGQTIQDATATMETLLRKYLIRPQVSLEVTAYSKRRFTLLGEVNKPGVYDMPDESSVNLLEAIGMAGGYTKIANPSRITIKRMVDDKETIIKLDGKKMLKDAASPTFQVQAGDTIVVGEALF